MEETSESRGEELEQTSRKGRKPNKIIREIEANREKAAGKQSSLDHLVIPLHGEKNSTKAQDHLVIPLHSSFLGYSPFCHL